MGIIARVRAQILWNRGLKRFYDRNCDEAVRLLEEACRLDPKYYQDDVMHYSILGRSYLASDRTDLAMTALTKAYELFRHGEQSRWGDFQREQFVTTLKAFANALHRCGQFERAKEVAREVTEYTATTQVKTY